MQEGSEKFAILFVAIVPDHDLYFTRQPSNNYSSIA